MISIVQVLETAIRERASDVHITPGRPPCLRIDGDVVPLSVDPLTGTQSKELCYAVITDNQKGEFESNKDLDFGFAIDNLGRFRGHLFYQKGFVAASFRHISTAIPKISDLNLPSVLYEIIEKPYGLVLVTGPTGSGKTTTLAALINEINKNRNGHIITLEDPIEYVFEPIKCIINQREIGTDVSDFLQSLKALLRMDPDVCMVGELRDKETIKTTLQVAETGHLVFGTLHTNTTYSSIDRLTGVFSGGERGYIQTQLSSVLQAVICQRLIPTKDGKGRVPALEILLFNAAVRNLVKEGKLNQIYSIMQTQKSSGMMTMNHSLHKLVINDVISPEVAFSLSHNESELKQLLSSYKYQRKAG